MQLQLVDSEVSVDPFGGRFLSVLLEQTGDWLIVNDTYVEPGEDYSHLWVALQDLKQFPVIDSEMVGM